MLTGAEWVSVIVASGTALSALIASAKYSRCAQIKILWGCIDCVREVIPPQNIPKETEIEPPKGIDV